MISKRDQAAKLRALAQKQGIVQKDEVLTYQALMQPRRSPAKIFFKIIKVLSALTLLAAFLVAGYYLYENIRNDKAVIMKLNEKSEHLTSELATLHDKTATIEADVVKNVKENQELNRAVQALHTTNKELQSSYTRIQQDKQAIEKELQASVKKIEVFEKAKQDLQTQTNAQITSLQAQVKELQSSVAKTQAVSQARAQALQQAVPQGVPASSIATPVSAQAQTASGAQPAPVAAKALEGKILLVNQNLRFVIVNIGSLQGARVGSRFTVTRDGVPIDTLRAIEVRSEVSACESKNGVSGLRAGDTVRVQ